MFNTFRALKFYLSGKDLRLFFVEGDEIDLLRLISGASASKLRVLKTTCRQNNKILIKFRIDSDAKIKRFLSLAPLLANCEF